MTPTGRGDNVIEHEHIDPVLRKATLPVFQAERIKGLVVNTLVYPCAVPGISLTNYSQNPQGKGWGPPCTGNRTTITLSNGVRITVRSEIAELVTLIMNADIRDGYAYRAADTGAYNCRYISGTTVWSNHAWALAIDKNWQSNPYSSTLKTDYPVWLRQRWNRYGFAWGGDYTGSKDAMHHEFMGTPAQAAAATALARQELAGGGGGGGHAPADPNDEVLTWGDKGRSVEVLQETLNRWYPKLTPLPVDGDFGDLTFDRVVYFQKAASLTADGEVGPASRAILGLEVPSFYDKQPPPKPALNPNGGIAAVLSHLPSEMVTRLGELLENERQTTRGGWVAVFSGGLFYWTPDGKGYIVWGGIRDAYAANGWEAGALGYPTSHEFGYDVPDQADGHAHEFAQSNFEHGYILWDAETGAVAVYQ
jgi:hypothetical protein